MNRRAYLRTAGHAGVAAVTAVAGCLDSRAAGDGDYDVGMSTVSFRPETVTVAVGDEVVWRNTSKQGHTVTARQSGVPEGGYFASGGFETESAARKAWRQGFGGHLAQGETFAHTFEEADVYDYYCIPHDSKGMVGRVVVEE